MAAEWPVLSLREAGVSLIDCEHKTPPSAENGYPYVAIPQIKAGRIDVADARRITLEHFVAWTRKANPAPYDVVLSRRCNPGETAFVPPGLECALGQNLVLLRTDGTKVLPGFLRWLVRGPQWWEQVGKFINVGAVFDSLKCADIPEFRLPIPPLDEQRAVAHILETLDDKMELNQRTHHTLEEIARAIFKSWFVEFDPVRAKMEGRQPFGMDAETAAAFPGQLRSSGREEIPEGWEAVSLGDEFDYIMGQSPPGSTYNEQGDGMPLYQGKGEFGLRFPARRLFCAAPKRVAKPGDTLVSVRAPVGAMNMAQEECCIGRGLAAVRHKSGSRSYTYYSMRELAEAFSAYDAEGTVFGSINKKDFGSMPCIRIPGTLIRRLEKILSPLDSMIELLEEERGTLLCIRDTLLPKLISGEVRIRDAEKMAEAAL